jgi:predicted phosphoribosyltransferase
VREEDGDRRLISRGGTIATDRIIEEVVMQRLAAFRDRADAGRQLAARLLHLADRPDVLVLALPRGGLPVGYEVARALHAPLDVLIVRKLGVPGQEELAMGAIASGGVRVLNEEVVRALNIAPEVIDRVAVKEQAELERREQLYRGDRPLPEIEGRTVVLVDDGIATGSTMRAAVRALRTRMPARLVVAAPTAPPSTCAELRGEVDELLCITTPEPFFAIGFDYEEFPQLSDGEVREILERAAVLPSLPTSR